MFEILYGTTPSYKHLRIFGCLAFAHNLDHKGDKFSSRSHRCVFLDYPYGKKGWRLYDLERKVVFTSRDVVFREKIFPFQTSTTYPLISSLVLPHVDNDAGSEVEFEHPAPAPDIPITTGNT